MTVSTNDHGQPVGLPVATPLPRPFPPHTGLMGQYCTLCAMREEDAPGLFDAYAEGDGSDWTYLPDAPWTNLKQAADMCRAAQGTVDPQHYTILDAQNIVSGRCALLRIAPDVGSMEVGWIHFAPRLQGTTAATEALVLLMRYAFETLGYRRFEWKCDALNAPSRRAAERLGFTYEGTFRQATVYKGRNRDTAWFSIVDSEWPRLAARFERWLDPANFDDQGQQLCALNAI